MPSSQTSVLQNNTNSSQQPSQQLQQQNSTENHVINNSSATSNSISNCVSPTSSRASPTPAITSPPQNSQPQQQQVMNGPTNLKNSNAASTVSAAHTTPDLMSAIKSMAQQDSISRTSIDSTGSQQSNQQQPQQQSQPIQPAENNTTAVSRQQHTMPPHALDSTTATTNGLYINANITQLLNSTSNMKSTETTQAHITPLLGVAPLGPMPLQKEHQVQVSILYLVSLDSSLY